MGEIMLVGLTSDDPKITPMDLRTIADWDIRKRLLSVPGSAQISVIGGELKQYQVLVDPFKLRNFNVSLHDVEEAAKNANVNSTGGFLLGPYTEGLIRNLARVNSLDDLRNSVIPAKREDGAALTLGQVAEVRLGGPLAKRGDAGVNGAPAVILSIQKQPGADTPKLTKQIEQELRNIQADLPKAREDPQRHLPPEHVYRERDPQHRSRPARRRDLRRHRALSFPAQLPHDRHHADGDPAFAARHRACLPATSRSRSTR